MPAKTKTIALGLIALILALLVWYLAKYLPSKKTVPTTTPASTTSRQYLKDPLALPAPSKSGRLSVETALQNRRTQRAFLDKSISLKQLGQMLWAAQGVTADWGGRTAPSAKEAYPLELYIVANKVDGLDKGIYHYLPGTTKPLHQIGLVKSGDFTTQAEAAVVQSPAKGVPVVIFLAGNMDKMTKAFDGVPSNNNVYLEAGHAAQNMYLQSESLDLGMVVIGGADATKVKALLDLPADETLIYAIPVGYPKE